LFNKKMKREVAMLRLAVNRQLKFFDQLAARVEAIEPAVFPAKARARLMQEVRYVSKDVSDETLLAEFRGRVK
jgi:hypothetical protein